MLEAIRNNQIGLAYANQLELVREDDHIEPKKSIEIKNLTIKYNGKTALNNITLNLKRGSITGIIGPNGAGKSTLIKGIMKLVQINSGSIMINGKTVEKERKNIAYVEQRSAIDLSFPINVFDTVLLGTYPKMRLMQRPGKSQRERAAEALETVKMTPFAKRQIGSLSGGQLQRVFIARALAQDADVFLLDEPFVGIDMVSEELIVKILLSLRDQGKTIAIVHHDLHKVEEYFDDVIILNRSLMSAGSVKETFVMDNITAAYGDTLGPILSATGTGGH
ncbi:MAG: metal ABC transporter ATP-binding protein [Lachnospiraceae bacterium]